MDENFLNDVLECPVCLERLDATAKLLPCQHTFCQKCLENIVSSRGILRCPECRQCVLKSVNQLPNNLLLVKILEGVKKSSQKENQSKSNQQITQQSDSKPLGIAIDNFSVYVQPAECGKLWSIMKNDVIEIVNFINEREAKGLLAPNVYGNFPIEFLNLNAAAEELRKSFKNISQAEHKPQNEMLQKAHNGQMSFKTTAAVLQPRSRIALGTSANVARIGFAQQRMQQMRHQVVQRHPTLRAPACQPRIRQPSLMLPLQQPAVAPTQQQPQVAIPQGNLSQAQSQQAVTLRRHSLHSSVIGAGVHASAVIKKRYSAEIPISTASSTAAEANHNVHNLHGRQLQRSNNTNLPATCVAIMDYKPEHPGELELKRGETYTVMEFLSAQFCRGKTAQHIVGYFPTKCVSFQSKPLSVPVEQANVVLGNVVGSLSPTPRRRITLSAATKQAEEMLVGCNPFRKPAPAATKTSSQVSACPSANKPEANSTSFQAQVLLNNTINNASNGNGLQPIHVRSGSCPSQLQQMPPAASVKFILRNSNLTLTDAATVAAPVTHHHQKSQSLDNGNSLNNLNLKYPMRFHCIRPDGQRQLLVGDIIYVVENLGDGWYVGCNTRTKRQDRYHENDGCFKFIREGAYV